MAIFEFELISLLRVFSLEPYLKKVWFVNLYTLSIRFLLNSYESYVILAYNISLLLSRRFFWEYWSIKVLLRLWPCLTLSRVGILKK